MIKHIIPKSSKEKNIYFFLVILMYAGANEFLDSFFSLMFLPYISYPTRVTGYSQIIFSYYISKEAVCGNLTSTLSDHLPQVLFIPSMFSGAPATKSNIFEKN